MTHPYKVIIITGSHGVFLQELRHRPMTGDIVPIPFNGGNMYAEIKQVIHDPDNYELDMQLNLPPNLDFVLVTNC